MIDMNFTNSPLVVHTHLSPNNYGPRTHKIDTITPHVVVGHVNLTNLGDWFAKSSTKASSNYGIDDNGNVGMYVEEKNAAWTSSNKANDNRAVTIEIASDATAPYAITDAALRGLIKLSVDVCKRNDIPKLMWEADKELLGHIDEQNMSAHRWFATKACPGDYLYGQLGHVAEEVNKLLGVAEVIPPVATEPVKDPTELPYLVKINPLVLHYRSGPGINYPVVGQVLRGEIYTIVDEAFGRGASKWGRLKSGVGWISLDYCTRVRR